MQKDQIIIIGGGASGLMAANLLLEQGHRITILEADNRLGGRIHTIRNSSFKQPVEKGVEFIHGNLPLTIELLDRAGIKYVPVEGRFYQIKNGKAEVQQDFAKGWDEVMMKMNEVKEDITLQSFLQKYFSGEEHGEVRRSVTRFAEGFDLADADTASVLALREEWMAEAEQYRIPGGYDQLINWLEEQCLQKGAVIKTSAKVKTVNWQEGKVNVIDGDQTYTANKLIVTISIGMLQSASIVFTPSIDEYFEAAKKMGFGTVIKILFEFKKAFWQDEHAKAGFFLTDEAIPTWWTQYPASFPLLTGWAGGPQATHLIIDKSEEEIINLALNSLSNIFQKPLNEIKDLLTAKFIANWKRNEFTNGAYSFNTLESIEARKILEKPVDNTIFFAGEGIYEGSSPGTVEAALVSGKAVAEKIVRTPDSRLL